MSEQHEIPPTLARGRAGDGGELMRFCGLLLKDPKVTVQPGWAKIILIGEAATTNARMFAYSYDAQGNVKLMAPSIDTLLKLRELRRSMVTAEPAGRAWVACMIRLSASGDASCEFEYDDPHRWNHTPENYQRRIAEYATLEV